MVHVSRSIVHRLALCMGLLLSLQSCDETDNATSDMAVQQSVDAIEDQAAPGADAARIEEETTDFEPEGDIPGEEELPTVEITWVPRDGKKKVVNTDTIELEVANRRSLPAEIEVTLLFSGILEESAELKLDTFDLPANEDTVVQVNSGDIPIQTTRGVCQATASVRATYRNDSQTVENLASAGTIFYKHLPNYKSMLVFDKDIFIRDHRGRFTDLKAELATRGVAGASNIALGRIKREDGTFAAITASSARADKAVVHGRSAPLVVGTGLGVAGDYATEEEEMRNGR